MSANQQAALAMLQSHSRLIDSKFSFLAVEDGVEISQQPRGLSFRHSFVAGPLAARAGQANQMLLKACNNKQRSINRVLDLTAGWGADGFILASHGLNVVLLEQNALVYACVAYSLALLEGTEPAGNLTIAHANSLEFLRALPDDHEFDCLYLDPMFPTHKSSAKPAKELQILQALTDNRDLESCFELALQTARKRVVVKRPAKAAGLSDLKPDLSYREKTIRFDVFLTH